MSMIEEIIIKRIEATPAGLLVHTQEDDVAIEKLVKVKVSTPNSVAKKMCFLASPNDLKELVVGALYSLNVVDSLYDVLDINLSQEPNNILLAIQIKKNILPQGIADSVITSSRGIPDGFNCEQKRCVKQNLQIDSNFLFQMNKELQARQMIFPLTGGTHAAGIFDRNGIIAFAEDIGRHNALDKAIGKCLLSGIDMSDCGVVLSSRISFEMLTKSLRAGLQIILAASAPTSLVLQIAEEKGMTLCGFVRDLRANVYTHPERIIDVYSEKD
ncbi:MAG: formate dehydrogenase accessory sulfurtransferase FdhD [Gammaproteobacteria bacterium]